ncbi:hypothetical protein [Myxococcus sp. RHSTA-1-4]|uniref:hypothetical protein n=1 Tax=Myxococcus sp. RHSTA-1-4 TaxID=2874601 RepID=UPI001CBD1F50|nr:hypothetical protein [Myxococcus sp. RHSTA-1-4]MBZ4419126.1 hypothetical protein [Myxococcus sp. RHSTA-1-4]
MNARCQTVSHSGLCALLLLTLALAGCEGREERPQKSPLPSPDGAYVARVDILEKPCVPGFRHCWVVSFQGRSGVEVFRDTEGFPARFNVYWAWDAHGRFWLYNSDNGDVFIYAAQGDGWTRLPAPERGRSECVDTATPDRGCPPPALASVIWRLGRAR